VDRSQQIPHPQLIPRQIDLHRQVCTIRPGRIDIRPARSLMIVPLAGFSIGLGCALAIWFGMTSFPIGVLTVLLLLALLLLPISGMGLVYAVAGANTIVDEAKQSATFQQGIFGLGLGTRELVPFWKMTEFAVEEVAQDLPAGDVPRDFVQYNVMLLKTSGKQLTLGSVVMPRRLASHGLARAREVAEALGALTEKPVRIPEPQLLAADGRRRSKRRKGRLAPTPGARSRNS
jgi:hypothetical protein